jgi:hypothetical protein
MGRTHVAETCGGSNVSSAIMDVQESASQEVVSK